MKKILMDLLDEWMPVVIGFFAGVGIFSVIVMVAVLCGVAV